MTNQDNLISVIIPVYNAEKFIEKCINSVLNQTYKNLEIIVVNDASTDRTLEILQSFDDERLHIITMKENSGCGLCRRRGISECKGDYLGMIDADDYINPDFYETLMKAALEHNADIVSSGLYIEDEDGEIIELMGNSKLETLSGRYKYFLDKLYFRYPNNSIYTRKCFSQVEYYPEPLRSDMPYRIAIRYFANMVVMIPYIGYHYVQQDDSLCHKATHFRGHIYDILADININNFLEEHPDMIIEQSIRKRMIRRLKDLSKKVLNSRNMEFAKNYQNELDKIQKYIDTHNIEL